MKHINRHRRDAGFTMIEVMVAILLTAIAIIGILALYMTQTRASAFSRHSTEATVLASDGLERIRTLTTPVLGSAELPASETLIDEQTNPGGIFTRTTAFDGTTWTVTVSWDENGTRSVVVYGRR